MSIKYRSEIDGLRAVAVIPVVFFHAGFNLFSGGYVGVDVFFVISGYLITTIILKELDKKTFSLKNFYQRRARRILPALIFVVLVSSVISFIFLTRSELGSYFRSVISTLLFYSNVHFYKTSPYFKEESDLEPLLHTWSLSIEEQFYIAFPIILLIFYRFFKKYIFLLFIFGFVVSLFIAQFLALKTSGTLNFYFTFSRAWELALGAMCAYLNIYKNLSYSSLSRNLLSLIGITMILISIFIFNRQTLYPSFYTLIPTIGTALIILFANENTYVKKILSIRLFVILGLVSYSFYLWHQPVLAFGRIFFENFLIFQKLTLLLLALIISIFSYHFIEKVFRNNTKIDFKSFLKTGFIISTSLLIFSYLNINFFSFKNSTEILVAKLLVNKEAVYSTKMNERRFIKNRIFYENLKPKILVIGSSRIMQISNENFTEQVFNLAVSGASIEDHIAITSMALEKFDVDKILLGADPWLFNKYNNQIRWKALFDEYQSSYENINSQKKKYKILKKEYLNNNFNFYEKILEGFYNILNIRRLDLEIKKGEINTITKAHILRDGTRVLKKKIEQEKFNPKVVEYSMEKYEFSEENYKIYKSFIEYLLSVYKKEVVLVLSPYQLSSYELTIQKKPFYLDLEKNFKKLSKETNVEIIGSYNPLSIPCDENDFYDSMHPKETCMIKVTNQIN